MYKIKFRNGEILFNLQEIKDYTMLKTNFTPKDDVDAFEACRIALYEHSKGIVHPEYGYMTAVEKVEE